MTDALHLDPDHHRLLRSMCARITGDPEVAEDIVQETLLRALVHQPDRSRPLAPWLARVARNLAIDWLRDRSRLVDLDEDEPSDEVEPGSTVDRRRLVGVLGRLSEGEVAVLLLRDVLDLDPAETARLLGSTPGSVRVLHHRARRALDAAPTPPDEAGLRAAERFLTWLLAHELVVGVPTAADGAQPALVAGVLRAHLALLDVLVDAADGPGFGAKARLARANIRRILGRSEEALADFTAAEAAAVEAGLTALAGQAASWSGYMLGEAGRMEEARARMEPWLDGAPPRLEARLRANLSEIALRAGAFDQAEAHAARCRTLLGDGAGGLAAAHAAGHAALLEDRWDEAAERFGEVLALARAVGHVINEAGAACNLGVVALGRGDPADARRWFAHATARARSVGDRRVETSAIANVAMVDLEEGRVDEALQGFDRAARGWRDLANARQEALARLNHAVATHVRWGPHRALPAIALAREDLLRTGMEVTLPFVDAHLAAAHAELGRDVAWPEGETGGVAAAIEVLKALSDGDATRVRRADRRFHEARVAARLVEAAWGRAGR